MKIAELQAKQGNVELEVEVSDVGEVRELEKFGKPGRVCSITIKDDSGEMKMSLWNEQIDQVNKGDKLIIKDAFVNEWQGEKQLTTGRRGTIEKA
jgi:replication factor A1